MIMIMLKRFIKKMWIHMLIAFNDGGYTVEGFERKNKKFECPENFSQLDPRLKRELTICNLFANQNQSMSNIAHLLDITMGKVVTTLIKYDLIKERRGKVGTVKSDRRSTTLPLSPNIDPQPSKSGSLTSLNLQSEPFQQASQPEEIRQQRTDHRPLRGSSFRRSGNCIIVNPGVDESPTGEPDASDPSVQTAS
jgi:hypothetical protein